MVFLCCSGEVEAQLAEVTKQKEQMEAALEAAEREVARITEDRSATLVAMLLVLMIMQS